MTDTPVQRTADEFDAYEITYDQIVELIVDLQMEQPIVRQAPLLAALRELQQRRIDERIAHNLELARLPA